MEVRRRIAKGRGLRYAGADDCRKIRLIEKNNQRRDIRSNALLKQRNICVDTTNHEAQTDPENVKTSTDEAKKAENIEVISMSRKERLLKWREEKIMLKKLNALNKKPVFKVCAVTHDKTPRLVNKQTSIIKKNFKDKVIEEKCPGESRRVTRSMAAAKTNKSVSNNIGKNTKSKEKCKESVTDCMKKSSKLQKEEKKTAKNETKSFAPDDFMFMVPGNLVDFKWEPTPLTPRASQNFIFNGSSSFQNNSSDSINDSKKYSPISEYSQYSLDKSAETSISIKSNPKILRTPVKTVEVENVENKQSPEKNGQSPLKDTSPKISEINGWKAAENDGNLAEKTPQMLLLPSKYFQKCDAYETPTSAPVDKHFAENTPDNLESTNLESKNLIFSNSLKLKCDDAKDVEPASGISDAISKIILQDTPSRNLRSNKQRASLLNSPAVNKDIKKKLTMSDDLISFSPVAK